MCLFQSYRSNTQQLFKLSLPIFISQLSVAGMGLADVVMAGLVSDNDLSAIAVSNSIYFPLFLFILGLLNALTPTVSYLNGANQRHLIAHQIHQGGWLVLIFSIPLIIILYHSHWILDFMQTPAEFSIKSQQYLAIMALGVIPSLLAINLRCLNEGLSNPKPAMQITFVGLILNIPLNYIFIFGKFGLPELGAIGCAVATVTVNWVMFALMLYYCYRTPSQKDIHLFRYGISRPNCKTLLKLLKLGLPIAFATFTEVMLFSSSALILSPFGSHVIASHQVALQTSSILFMIPLSFSIASAIMIGKSLGEKQFTQAKQISQHILITGILFALCVAFLILLFRHIIPLAFTQDSVVSHIAANLLIFAAIYQIPDSIQVVCEGILRGYKHTKPILFTTLFCYWGIGMPIGCILSRTDWLTPAPMAAQGFWFIFCVSLTFASVLLYHQVRTIQSKEADFLNAYLEKIK